MCKSVALVVEGGGMRASYTARFFERLISSGVEVGWAGGISAGASQVLNYLSHDEFRVRVSFSTLLSSRRIGGLAPLLLGRGLFDGQYLYQDIAQPDGALPFDFEAFFAHPAEVCIQAVRADTGETVTWNRADLPTKRSVMLAARASATMPGVMKIPFIDGHPYVDGAVGDTGGIPIAPALGREKFAIVLTRPRGFRRTALTHPEVLRAVLRKYPAVVDLMMTRHERYNASLELVDKLEREGKAKVFYPEGPLVSNKERDGAKIMASYQAGREQVDREWPEWLDFFNS